MDQGSQGVGTGPDRRYVDWGALIFGAIVLVVGAYLLLKDTFKVNLPDISWDMFWPVIVIAIGVIVLVRALTGDTHRGRRYDR
jgi:uncharacterized integral membrane protein